MYRFWIDKILHSVKTLYLFTADDLISIVLPNSLCGIALPLSGGILQQPASVYQVIPRVPLVLSWVWINLLFFNMSNQSQPGAIPEDVANKPWRPIASGRISAHQVQSYITATRFGLFGIGLALGGTYPSLVLQALTFWYNDLHGGEGWISRNLLNAGGYLCFTIGAMQVAVGTQTFDCSNRGFRWLWWTSAVISCTMHTQDLYDQEGDELRGRRTIPLVFGDSTARYSIAVAVVVWSSVSPAYWTSSVFGFLPTVALGTIITMRLLRKAEPNVAHDKRTFVYWNAWIISIHMLPLWGRLFELP